LNIKVTTVEAEKCLGLEVSWEHIDSEHLKDNAILMPIFAGVLIYVERTTLRTFSSLHEKLLHGLKRTCSAFQSRPGSIVGFLEGIMLQVASR